jgi:D-lactate dehydrogenase (cytochrome)
MRDNVVSLIVVMPDGRAVRTARRAKKTAAGYDLTRLMLGSEGTLGLITELTLKLHGIPEVIASGVCAFDTLEGACNTAIMTIQAGVPIARIELLDELQVRMSNAYSKLSLPEKPTLFLEFHGSDASVTEQTALFRDIAAENGGGEFEWATRAEERTRLWQARHDAYWSARAWRPGAQTLATDACVPISRLAECVTETRADLDASGLLGAILGHVGDGNFHVSLLFDADDTDELSRVKGFLERLALRAIAMDGTCTGEHGVGQGKMKYLEAEIGLALDVMRALKRAIDPHNIMNPGKILAA